MQANRPLAIVVLLVVAAATAVWFVSRGDARLDLPTQPGSAQPGALPTAADPAAGSLAPTASPEPAADATSRVEAASAAPVVEAALLGRVVDDRGQPVAGAVVRDVRGSPFGAEAFDGDMFEAMANDPEGAIARVRAARREGRDTTTDADGAFRLAVPDRGGMVSLRVEARGHQVLDRNVARPTAGELDVGVLQLERGAIVTGRVVDRAGTGIADAIVLREPGGVGAEWMSGVDIEFPGSDDADSWLGERARTDAEGRFELSHLGPGEFTLRARHPEHPFTRQAGLTVAAGAALRDLVLVLEPGATIRGRVVDVPAGTKSLRVAVGLRRDPAPAGAPEGPFAFFGGADVFDDMGGFGERSTAVGADGAFELRGLRIGRAYRVWATQTGRGMLGNAACTQRLEVTTPIEGIELRYDPGIAVTFQVVGADGAPVERLWVNHLLRGGGGMEELMGQAMARRGRAADHADGRVVIQNLRPKDKQTLTLTVDAIGFARFERKDIVLPRSGDLDLGIVRLAPVPVLHVQVLASGDGTPIAGASVRVRERESDDPQAVSAEVQFGFFADRMGGGGGASAGRTGDDGRCMLNAPVDKPFVVTVTSNAYARHESQPLTLDGLAGGQYVVRLLHGGTVEVTAVDAEGAVAPGQRIEHRAPDGARDDKTGSDAGVATFERLAPGTHQFRIGDRAGGPAFLTMTMEIATGQPGAAEAGWQRVEVEDGATVPLQLVKAATAGLRGVVRENGLPLAGARITFLKGAESNGAGGDLAEMMADFGGRGGSGRSTRSGDDGSYQLRELPEGSHRLRITASGRSMPALVAVQLLGTDNVFDVDLDVSTVRGVVRGADGQPLAGATVRVVPVRAAVEGAPDPMGLVEDMVPGGLEMLGGGTGGKSAKSDANGRYELRGVQAGTSLQVRATAKGHAPAQSAAFEVEAGGARDGVDLQLRQAGRIKVTMATKTPFVFATASPLDAAGNVDKDAKPVVQMLRNGAGTLDGLRAGRWRVTLRTPNGEAEPPRDVDVVAGETATIAF
ncbi:MAG: carboxypeptidase regulatory-like domain-containing protein [Planctomycetes bacterium]|nr:carboxypeptidase regulatory-like domain-containing protein [Planctomycetota bacterium]